MNARIKLGFAVAAFVCLIVPAAGQNSIKCESGDGRRNYCGSYRPDQVRMDRQISGSPCVQGDTWGVDGRGLWVDRGCRAYFVIRGGSGNGQGGGGGYFPDNGQNSIKCESGDGRRNYCGSYRPDQVRLDRQISGSACVQGSTWGVDGRGLWVDRGCRAYFVIWGGPGSGPGGGSGSYPGGGEWWHLNPGDSWPPQGNWHGGHWGSGGACFYRDTQFRGDYFCLRRGESRDALSGYGDKISSIRTFGGAVAMVYDDRNFSGAHDPINGAAGDLRNFRVTQKPDHTWNDRISSVRVR